MPMAKMSQVKNKMIDSQNSRFPFYDSFLCKCNKMLAPHLCKANSKSGSWGFQVLFHGTESWGPIYK